MDRVEIHDILEGSEFFSRLKREEIEKVASLCQVKTYGAGEFVFRQGDFGEEIFIIAEGHVFLERSVDLDTKKGTAVYGILGQGRVLGCWSTLLGEPHTLMSSATCQKPTRVLSIKGSALRDMMIENREFGFNILERLCFLLRDRIQGALGAMEKI
ncbi:MAG: cyclic nucleotide-binding domain-containing protein [Deltaproteobacteria bacterium]|nr:cyclic nucleotide-binding domain-containing protein [Deltaproteobacteria bacterium]MBW2136232.1 cyclic nucleotide-binding domain-containing protein [Deltaproteobacteria bacterium]